MIVNASACSIPLADASVHAIVTSPPYWGGLREYAGAQERLWPPISYSPMPELPEIAIASQRASLGLEDDVFAYIGHLVHVFRECRRILRPDGVLVVNIGDCYSNPRPGSGGDGRAGDPNTWAGNRWSKRGMQAQRLAQAVPTKNLVLQPWRLALALQADGWILRSRCPGGIDAEVEPDIVWKKPTCVPLTARDRPTVDFEDVLVFSLKPRYYWDQIPGMETTKGNTHFQNRHKRRKADPGNGFRTEPRVPLKQRTMRTVWTVPAQPTGENHYAAFPAELAARMIRMGTSDQGCCPECGEPWGRMVERRRQISERADLIVDRSRRWAREPGTSGWSQDDGTVGTTIIEKGWQPGCDHGHDPIPCRVFDPFNGIGRTWEACQLTGRRYVGSDLALEYCRISRSRHDIVAAARRRAAAAKAPRTIDGPLFSI